MGAYHIVCRDCGKKNKICCKGQVKGEDIQRENSEDAGVKREEIEREIKYLPERKRRTIQRMLNRDTESAEKNMEDAMELLQNMKLELHSECDEEDDDDDFSDDEN